MFCENVSIITYAGIYVYKCTDNRHLWEYICHLVWMLSHIAFGIFVASASVALFFRFTVPSTYIRSVQLNIEHFVAKNKCISTIILFSDKCSVLLRKYYSVSNNETV